MKKIALDWSRLLGFDQVQKLQAKVGKKPPMPKIGSKIGGKVGVKVGK